MTRPRELATQPRLSFLKHLQAGGRAAERSQRAPGPSSHERQTPRERRCCRQHCGSSGLRRCLHLDGPPTDASLDRISGAYRGRPVRGAVHQLLDAAEKLVGAVSEVGRALFGGTPIGESTTSAYSPTWLPAKSEERPCDDPRCLHERCRIERASRACVAFYWHSDVVLRARDLRCINAQSACLASEAAYSVRFCTLCGRYGPAPVGSPFSRCLGPACASYVLSRGSASEHRPSSANRVALRPVSLFDLRRTTQAGWRTILGLMHSARDGPTYSQGMQPGHTTLPCTTGFPWAQSVTRPFDTLSRAPGFPNL